ncbi:MAG: hypothetical protein HOF23_02130 [Rhodospirillaceae bacterium]|jgi:hypothetical protein|nr:hypothetical protein [Rhodospirillaceae bacterium]
MESLIYIANGMYLLAYFMSDMLRLRVLTIIATSCLVIYFSMRPEPMATIICWNLFFAALNIGQVCWLCLKKQHGDLTEVWIQSWKNSCRENLQLIEQSLSGPTSVYD